MREIKLRIDKTFEDFLREKHAEQYCGLDDNMSDDCEVFISRLEPDDFIEYADKFADEIREIESLRRC